MIKKIISITLLSLFAIVSLNLSSVKASEVTGTLSSGGAVSTGSTGGGSISGSVVSGSTISGTVTSGSSGGGGGGSGGGGNSLGQLASANFVTTNPGLPSTGQGGLNNTIDLLLVVATLTLVLSSIGIYVESKKVQKSL